jgi:beta-lactamase regulating signal transducer with metallopeptidase domain
LWIAPTGKCDWRWLAKLGCGNVELRQSRQVQVPLMVGFVRPTILLPHNMAAELEARYHDAVIVHELAHARLSDLLNAFPDHLQGGQGR